MPGLRKAGCRIGLAVISLGVSLLASSALAQWTIPEEHQGKADVLDEQQLAFLTSGDALHYLPERQLEHELATRDEESLRQLVSDLMALHAQMAYDPERDMGAIPLNLKSRRFGGAMATPEPLRKFERDAGPFSVHRYISPMSGVPTFGGAKVAIYPEDLVAGKVDVAMVGVPSNMSSGRRDASFAPDYLRAFGAIGTTDEQSLVKPMEVLSVVDYGSFFTHPLNIELSVDGVTLLVTETAATGAVPFLVGGDTSILYPAVKGVSGHRGAGEFGLLHFSAHADVDGDNAHTLSDTKALFALLDGGVVDGGDTVTLGLRGPNLDADTLRWLRDQGVRYHTMGEIRQRGFERVLKSALSEVGKGPDDFFVSIDVSVIEPAEMIGAGRIETQGLRVAQVAKAIREVCATKNIVGFGITDLAPMMDFSRLSVANTAALLNACLAGMAVKRAGLDPDYVHPLVLTHGQR